MTDHAFDPSRAGLREASIIGGERLMRLSSRRILPAGFLAAVLAALLVATGAFAGEQPKTEKILISDHIGDATIVMISGVDTGRAVVTFKREIDDIVEDCARNDYKNEDGDISSDEVVKCTREGLKASGGEALIRRANCLRATLSMEFGNFSLIDYVKEEHGLVRTNWKNHKDNKMNENCSGCGTPELLDTYRVLCPSRYKAAFDGLHPY
jgi:hypothetical protein